MSGSGVAAMKPRNSPDTKVRPIGNIPGCRGRAIEIRTSAWCVEVEKHKWEVRHVNRFDSRVVGDWRERDSGGAAAGVNAVSGAVIAAAPPFQPFLVCWLAG